ncbi:AI-2E family transporter [Aureliella helgolandensis]|uniref:AI-2 transport protein TqsA n=1 Tax=Aureliella helgolandensis TaxID=2527968 RepID=A0A518G6P9_9BACT|nr:AI-2E family transporter [Aureliella helgolandensis]QDV24256.1 AI-2 transport protein TqsA [Aureliella helgolandensis]
MPNSLTSGKIATICLVIIATSVATHMIYWLRPVLVPFVVALFVVSGITPLLDTLEKRLKVNRLVAATLTFLCGLVTMGVLGACLWLSVAQMSEQGEAYQTRVKELVTKTQDWLDLDRHSLFGFSMSGEEDEPQKIAADLPNGLGPSASIRPEVQPDEDAIADAHVLPNGLPHSGIFAESHDPTLAAIRPADPQNSASGQKKFRQLIDSSLRAWLGKLSSELLGLISTSVVVLIYVFFLLLGSVETTPQTGYWIALDQQVRSYLFLKTIISILTGAAFGCALWIFGVPMSLSFGVLAFLLNYIPNVGPLVASLLPIPFILLNPDGTLMWMVGAISVTTAIQVVSGSVIEPKLMGESSDLHPVVILLALMFWGMMWGITGMFLATPITAGIKIVLESTESTKPFANILAGRFSTAAANTNRAET